MTEKLKPCPFCGGEAQLVTPRGIKINAHGEFVNDMYFVHCTACHIETPIIASESQAVAVWNRRVPDG